MRCYGNPDLITPSLDALAVDGVLFETCYVQNPICGPSRASFATGQYARNHGLYANGVELDTDRKMVSRALADAGYDCGMSGKQHLGPCATGDEVCRDDGYRVYKWSHNPIHQSETMLRHRDDKLVVWHGAPSTARQRDGELYDLAADPHETVNLFHDAAHRDTRDELKDVLIDVWAATELRTGVREAEW